MFFNSYLECPCDGWCVFDCSCDRRRNIRRDTFLLEKPLNDLDTAGTFCTLSLNDQNHFSLHVDTIIRSSWPTISCHGGMTIRCRFLFLHRWVILSALPYFVLVYKTRDVFKKNVGRVLIRFSA
ncbi:uncharacterized protein LY89DRAFT_182810 [Mollisia scopiformis]|uniref:Uncharacterized protein n=1 Tax=Mollisia scopiformis TaxID=149040 RepID=A0A194XTI3_MOLSC|nr:uncharacterized protein LY89DRAFT_182810 [Mollisia scopiformis]KUJ23451.1 hypothetical protein LY89DRAFT_182810 [Mollisia scopiformis]